MSDDSALFPPELLSPAWLIVGAILIVVSLGWLGAVFFVTRHRKPKTISSLQSKAAAARNLDRLKKKYLKLIVELENADAQKTVTARQVNQQLSSLLRLFVFEASGFKAHVMTLSDLEQGRFPELSTVIRDIYPEEFPSAIKGATANSFVQVKGLIQSWG